MNNRGGLRVMTWLVAASLVGCAGDSLEPPPVRSAKSAAGKATNSFRVNMETSRGTVVIEVYPDWAPLGASRFRELVEAKFFDECRFFRVVPNFVVQFGINGDPEEHQKWSTPISDDPVTQSNLRGTLTFATSGRNTRTSQLFINLKNNAGSLDGQGFSPFGKVVSGMEHIDAITSEYGERPQQPLIERQGNEYLKRDFPNLDYVKTARVVPDEGGVGGQDELDGEAAEAAGP